MKKTKSSKVWLMIACGVFVVMILCFILWLKPSKPLTLDNNQSVVRVSDNAIPPNHSQTTVTGTQPIDTLPKTDQKTTKSSLDGTQVDGEIIIDEHKSLVVTYGLRRLFDYFLTTQGELSLEQIHSKVTKYIESHTPEPASSQAIKIYYQYVDYLQQIADFEKNIASLQLNQIQEGKIDLSIVEQRQRQAYAIRQKIFDKPTQQAFFSQEDNLNNYNMAVIKTNQNNQLTPSERQKTLNELRQQYLQNVAGDNEQLQQRLNNQQNINELIAETERLKQQGATAEQIRALRRKYVSEDAVSRLDEMDRQENDFLARIQAFEQQKQQIVTQYGDTAQSKMMIDELKQAQFSQTEQLRVDVFTKNKTPLSY
ncbi:lipase secretion chaperone [Moraxella boevrei]|uniref:lipase secretion chaperone n=1 Tax=Faucicola boevrei TaxID=346665 RepID=UPI0037368304